MINPQQKFSFLRVLISRYYHLKVKKLVFCHMLIIFEKILKKNHIYCRDLNFNVKYIYIWREKNCVVWSNNRMFKQIINLFNIFRLGGGKQRFRIFDFLHLYSGITGGMMS